MTNSPDTLERSVIKSSVMPSVKYSWPVSLDMLANGSTAIDGLSGRGSAIFATEATSTDGFEPSSKTFQSAAPPVIRNRAAAATTSQLHSTGRLRFAGYVAVAARARGPTRHTQTGFLM